MKFFCAITVAVLTTLATGSVRAQFVKGNEAVRLMADGTKKVETPRPSPHTSLPEACAAAAGCHAGPWYMVETADGLRECTEPLARPTTCRASTYGAQKLSRLWIAKRGATWLWCQYPDLERTCVPMHARPPLNLPVSAVQ
jgi:hypothetical protein